MSWLVLRGESCHGCSRVVNFVSPVPQLMMLRCAMTNDGDCATTNTPPRWWADFPCGFLYE